MGETKYGPLVADRSEGIKQHVAVAKYSLGRMTH
jgi:hypothetical protein